MGVNIEVFGPFRNGEGIVTAMSATEQKHWAESIGGRLPTAVEFDAIWNSACVQVTPHPRRAATAPLDALNEDVAKAIEDRGEATDRVAAGKTWLTSRKTTSHKAVNYGFHVPLDELMGNLWRGIKTYAAKSGNGRVIQPEANAHIWGHKDYSQLGYAVRDIEDVDDTDPPPKADDKPPTFTVLGNRGADVRALQEWFLDYGHEPARIIRETSLKPNGSVDGIHGDGMERAIAAYLGRELASDTLPPSSEPSSVILPEVSFRQAKHYRPGRIKGPPIWIVIHTAETIEHSEAAESLQAYAATMPDGRVASWHFSIDDNTICQSVRCGLFGHNDDTAFAAPGANARGIQIELAGRARQNEEDWHDPFSTAQLDLCAQLVSALCLRWDIPADKVGPTDMRAGMPGICGHRDVSKGVGKGRTSHTDPGIHFPWDEFLEQVRSMM